MKKFFITFSFVIIGLAQAAWAQGYTFTKNLTVGSSGSDVVALQVKLIDGGYHIPSIESGLSSKGYFGSQTKAAVIKYQTDVGLPKTGFFGPLTRGKLNEKNNASLASSPNCPEGYICSSIGSVSPAGLPAGLNTPGIPGIMAVSQGPLSVSTMYVGQTQVPIMTVRIHAQYSDIDFNGLVLDLGTDTAIYNKIFSSIYVTSGDKVLFSTPLNSTSVVQVQGQYVVGTAGYDFIIPKGTYKDIVIKADIRPSIDSHYISQSPWYISIDSQAVSGLDGAGVILYGPASDGLIVQGLTINTSLVDTAQANLSRSSASPLAAAVPVTDTTNGQYLGLPVLAFDINAQNDTLHLHQIKVGITTTGTGSVGAAYLYNGSTLITSASVSNGVADFANITNGTEGATILKDQTGHFWVKVDVTGVTSGTLAINTNATSSLQTIYNSQDGTATVSGSAAGNTQTIASIGPLFTLSGAPTITKTNQTPGGATVSTFQYQAVFNVNVTAVGTDVMFGLPASSTPSFGTSTASTNAEVFANGVASSTFTGGSVSYSKPSNTTLDAAGTSFTLSRNQTVTIPVTYTFTTTPNSNTFAVQMQGITTSIGQTNFMLNQPEWRTDAK